MIPTQVYDSYIPTMEITLDCPDRSAPVIIQRYDKEDGEYLLTMQLLDQTYMAYESKHNLVIIKKTPTDNNEYIFTGTPSLEDVCREAPDLKMVQK